jgi:hypothetical protein
MTPKKQIVSRFSLVCVLLMCIFVASATITLAQHPRRETLTPAEVDQVREAAIEPAERVKLFTKFADERANKIKDLTGRPKSMQRAQRLDDALQDLTSLMDELGSNLDVYSDRHSDIRKGLKPLSEAMPRWLGILRALPGEPAFDLARKEAIESQEDLADQATRLMHEQDDYFATHKDEKGQERNDPLIQEKDKPKP